MPPGKSICRGKLPVGWSPNQWASRFSVLVLASRSMALHPYLSCNRKSNFLGYLPLLANRKAIQKRIDLVPGGVLPKLPSRLVAELLYTDPNLKVSNPPREGSQAAGTIL